MAPTLANSGHAPTTLTLKPFHTDSQSRQQQQQYRLPRIAQQAPPPVSSPHIRNSRTPNYAPSFSASVSASSSRSVRSIPSSSLTINKPTVVNTRSPLRAPASTTALTRTSDASSYHPKSPSSTRTARNPVTTVAKVHAIAPIGATSIDSILHAGSQDANKVPDRIRPKAEAIK